MSFFKNNKSDKPTLGSDTIPYNRCNESFWLLENGMWKLITEGEFIAKEIELGVNPNRNTERRVTDGFHKNGVLGRIMWYEVYREHFRNEPDFLEALAKEGMLYN
ncbi:MAG: hypothetical protein KBC17_04000 [Candidatus Pacebacteria bacterium]|nr:hypothetical protein [Candidatus Paceibacterota bacterium]